MLKSIFLDTSILLYLATILVSLYTYKKYFDTSLKYFPILLMYVLLTEILGLIIRLDPKMNPFITGLYSNYNYIIYYIYHFIYLGYFYYVFWQNINSEKVKRSIFFIAIVIGFSLSGFGQLGRIYGTVKNGEQLEIGAQVELYKENSYTEKQTVTSENGEFVL